MAEPTGESIATCLRLGKSLGLARQGRLREAQQLLAAEGTLPENPLELHALAALATGDGDYTRAQRLWRLLLQREPGHAEAKRMIDAIELWVTRPAWMAWIPIGAMLACGALLLGLAAWMMADSEPAPTARPPAPRPVSTAPVYTPSAPPPTVNFSTPARRTDNRQNRNR